MSQLIDLVTRPSVVGCVLASFIEPSADISHTHTGPVVIMGCEGFHSNTLSTPPTPPICHSSLSGLPLKTLKLHPPRQVKGHYFLTLLLAFFSCFLCAWLLYVCMYAGMCSVCLMCAWKEIHNTKRYEEWKRRYFLNKFIFLLFFCFSTIPYFKTIAYYTMALI